MSGMMANRAKTSAGIRPLVGPAGEHELAILATISSGMGIDEILASGPWSLTEVTSVMRRHGLVTTSNGQVIRDGLPLAQLRTAVGESPSPFVRQQAERAHAQLLALGKAIAMQTARDSSDDVRREQRHALQSWLEWLRAAQSGARDELDRLRASSPRSARAKRATS
ncbi:hypothetical protein LWC34_38965 [Kibdelosporangium philippinense]|uniref:Uncharacterized protein n=1 Tax=Kibdelosporangium philippinense TaxID=211113 RepID=A0ABS8ZMK6_9PSEU|nr:hypothetical protein [Kibdelosporangium philippinense]MCE7008752.1 hypothetical protein [Kibdelosporangium philippinense]